jgi:hypothetical protein
MAFSSSPSIVTNGLSFYYDMNNTQKSYKGKPITNQYPLPTPDGSGNVSFPTNGTGTFRRIYSGVFGGYEIKPTDVVYRYDLGGTGCHYHGGSAAIASGQYATMTFDYYISQDAANYPTLNLLANFENYGGTALSGSAGAPNTARGVWQTVTFSAGPSASGGTQAMFLYPGSCGGSYLASSGYILYKNPQVIFSSSANDVQAFTSSARSNTQSLVDLARNTSITANSLTYNSNGTFSFNGTSDYLTLPSSVGAFGTGDFTISCWWKSNGTQASYVAIMEQGFTGAPSNGAWAFKVSHSSGDFNFTYYNGGIVDNTSGNNPNDGIWHNLVAVRSGTSLVLYKDTTAVKSITLPVGYSFGEGSSVFVGYNPRDAAYLKGDLPVLQTYSRALTSTEIQKNFNTQRARYGV